ncbi:hypothetical protein [Methylobacterium persicinum]|uniref:Uncharacterized protein n=1 Tax=Methylobacterium persicinum TaxID=374426 RepID=A0ABU0HSN5_9HYPH|nr:hypothetical protein [Methylobacterium persicinum]MDQ0445337.1 hypothetical protein [Methylobacterium persicinum]GJE39774.1 hypothetical protein KHHGKMAE_3860 [Methylobacterium persicinum]
MRISKHTRPVAVPSAGEGAAPTSDAKADDSALSRDARYSIVAVVLGLRINPQTSTLPLVRWKRGGFSIRSRRSERLADEGGAG